MCVVYKRLSMLTMLQSMDAFAVMLELLFDEQLLHWQCCYQPLPTHPGWYGSSRCVGCCDYMWALPLSWKLMVGMNVVSLCMHESI